MKKNVYFIPRNTWFYATFSRLPVYVRYCITLAVLCAVFFLWRITSYSLFAQRQTNYLVGMKNLQEQQGKLEEMLSHAQQLQRDVVQKKQDLAQYFSGTKEHDLYVQRLLEIMQQHHLKLQAYSPESQQAKKWYTKNTVRLDLVGSYENILSFLDTVAAEQLPIVCSSLHLEKRQEGILASCHISHYDFHKDEHEK